MNNLRWMTIVSFVVFMASGVTGPVNSLYVESLGASYVAIGLLGTAISLTSIVFGYVWGRVSDRLGRRKGLLSVGLTVMAISYGLMVLAQRYELLFPIRVLGAIAMAAYSTSNLALVGDLLEGHTKTRGRRMGTLRGLSSLGFGMMAFISGSIADRFSLRVPFALAAGLLVVAVIVLTQVQEDKTRAHDLPESAPKIDAVWRRFVSSVRMLTSSLWHRSRESTVPRDGSANALPLAPLLISALLWSLATGAVYAVWANYMVGELDYTQATMSRLWAIASMSEFPLMIAAGWLSDRLGRLPMLGLGFAAWTVVFVGYIIVPRLPWIVLVQLTRGFAYSAYTAAAMTYAAEARSQANRGRVSGLFGSAGGIGAILGAAAGGTLTEAFGFRVMIATNACLMAVAATYVLAVYLRRSTKIRSRVNGS